MSPRNYLPTMVAAALALHWVGAAAAAEPRQKVPPSVGPNEIVVAKNRDLRDQIRDCWNLPAMSRREDFHVHVAVKLKPNGTVHTARVVGPATTANDPFRRSVAQSARHALMSARCNPLRVPEGAGDKGERLTLTFNPSEIFGD